MFYMPWLPDNALYEGVLKDHFQDLITQWTENWFTTQIDLTLRLVQDTGGQRDPNSRTFWVSSDGHALISLPEKGDKYLIHRLLQLDGFKSKQTRQDKDFMIHLLDEIMTDLLKELCNVLGLDGEGEKIQSPPEMGQNGGLLSVFSPEGDILMDIQISKMTLINMRKDRLTPEDILTALNSLEEAIDIQIVSLGARVGESQLSLGELDNLSVGDVIVLDQSTEAALTLTLNGQIVPEMSCRGVEKNNKICLTLEP